jgi:hypothetical protein
MQAVELSASGRHHEADPALIQLGYRYRLSDEIWATCRGLSHVSASREPSSPPPLHSSLLSQPVVFTPSGAPGGRPSSSSDGKSREVLGPLISRLQQAFAPDAAFWSYHRYFEEQTPYFSYIHTLVRHNSSPSSLASSVLQSMGPGL